MFKVESCNSSEKKAMPLIDYAVMNISPSPSDSVMNALCLLMTQLLARSTACYPPVSM